VVETVDNPFDLGKSFLGIDSRSARRKIKKIRIDLVISMVLTWKENSKGQTLLISYSESI
jgi:hypothetical protein